MARYVGASKQQQLAIRVAAAGSVSGFAQTR